MGKTARLRRAFPWLLAALLLAMVSGYYALTEPVTYMKRVAPDSSITRNPYSAAQQWLAQRGQPSKRILSAAALFPLPDTRTTLVIDKHRGMLTSNQVNALLEWVQDGGKLVVEARPLPGILDTSDASASDWQDNDPLLFALGITVWDSPVPSDAGQEDAIRDLLMALPTFVDSPLQYCLHSDNEALREDCARLACDAPPEPTPLTLHVSDNEPDRRVQLFSDYVIWHDSWDEEEGNAPHLEWPVEITGYADNDYGSQLVQLSLGSGQISVLTDLSLWSSERLLYFDHAWLLAWLTGAEPVWFVRSVAMPPLAQWLWLKAPALAFALLILLVLWLWHRIPRQGPRQQAREESRRDYLKHLHASGYFQWRTNQQMALLAELRKQAEQQLLRFHHQRNKALALAAKALSVPVKELDAALQSQADTRDRFTQQVSLLQSLKNCRH
ncbi:hypothetical protein AS19_16020 [Alcanivorax sp. NBRC 101098]|jgi:hypothetical protein|uniref:DUF4350 domain-containing protein n=1 Tax=Alcanivorax sp. NBRC 101098 TaxID=1113728 RepID=UPI0004ABE0E4|nr:DUF4350 domain-containing protein [Alcanivorax sp. NBRC 101098]BAP14453.1 hypothetical protein AS19_16020 [Alcanivorax sp. NBRC 101098]